MTLVSVVIPCYNQGRFLAEAIESALDQGSPQVEVLVVDDGSTDETAAVAARYPCVVYLRQTNAGLGAARNTGLRRSRGEYLVFLDADDRLLPGALQTGLESIAAHPHAAFISGRFRYIHEDGAVLDEIVQEPAAQDPYLAFLQGNYIGMHAAVLYRRAALEAAGGFNPALPCCEDYDLYLRLARQHPVARHPGLVAEYRQHSANMSADSQQMLKTVLAVLRSQWPHVHAARQARAAYRAGVRFWKSYYSEKLWLQIVRSWSSGRPGRAAQALCTWVRYAPVEVLRYSAGAGLEKVSHMLKTLLPTPIYRFLLKTRGRVTSPPAGRVSFGDLRRVSPLSREFGYDRGLPIDRYYIEAFLAGHGADIQGHVLEIGDDSYTRRFGGPRVAFCDVLHINPGNPRATIVADLAEGDAIPADTFDCVVLTQTLHLIFDVRSAVKTLHRILKPGGVLLATFPGISQVSTDEWAATWYWAFTTRAAARLFAEVFPPERVEIQAHGNVLAATSFLYGLAVDELEPEELDFHDPNYELLITLRAVKPA